MLPLLYVKRFENNSPSVMFSNQFACVRSLLVKHRTDCPPLLRRFSIAFPLSLPPRCLANTKRPPPHPPPHPPRRPATTLFGHGDGDDRVVGWAPAGSRYRYVTLFKRKNLSIRRRHWFWSVVES